MEYTTKEEWGVCAECGQYHKNPIRKNQDSTFEDDIASMLELTEELQIENKELNATIEIMQRELHDARQELKIAHLEKDILRLELLKTKSAKFDESPWQYVDATYPPKPIKTELLNRVDELKKTFSKGEK